VNPAVVVPRDPIDLVKRLVIAQHGLYCSSGFSV